MEDCDEMHRCWTIGLLLYKQEMKQLDIDMSPHALAISFDETSCMLHTLEALVSGHLNS